MARRQLTLVETTVDIHRIERGLRMDGYRFIAGLDEAGRGPLAGPVVAAAVVLEDGPCIEGLDDSKRLSPDERRRIIESIREQALAVGIGIVDHKTIDRMNILQASLLAMSLALEDLGRPVDLALVDGNQPIPSRIPQRLMVKGDRRYASIAAAYIVAKVTRDAIMDDYHKAYPVYGFDRNRGYATKRHIEALRRFGPCDIHRRSFAPVCELLAHRKGDGKP